MTPDEQAKALLPCICGSPGGMMMDNPCPHYYRDGVAAALREKDEQVTLYWQERMLNRLSELHAEHKIERDALQAERDKWVRIASEQATRMEELIASSEKKVAELEAELAYCKRLALEADDRDDARLAAAKVEGLRLASEAIVRKFRDMQYDFTVGDIRRAIDAEIAALERGKGE